MIRRHTRDGRGVVLVCDSVATEEEVDRTLHDLARRLAQAQVEHRSLPERRSLAVFIKDLDVTYTAVFGDGVIADLVKQEPTGTEDVRIFVSGDDLVSLANGRMGVGGALLTGRLRVDAGMSDLLLLRRLF